MTGKARYLAAAAGLAIAGSAMAAQAGERAAPATAGPAGTAEIVVTAITPLGTADEASRLPPPARTIRADAIEDSHAVDLTDYLRRMGGGVFINDIQNNPLQPDVNYRGFTASPLLGTPQGLSLYMDGVRLNQPFGDVVSWDLIPREAIEAVTIIPGSNPLFGRNTLGGALSIRTKDGRSAPGSEIEASYGSFRRRVFEATTGGSAASGLHWFVTANRFQERGWRDASPSKASQIFGKLGWADARTDIALSGSYADTDLTGNGLQELQFLERDRSSVYTKPDNTRNRAGLVNLTARHAFSDSLSFSGNAYWRRIATRTLNGDINEESLEENVYQPNAAERAALTAAGYSGFPLAGETAANAPFPQWRCIANILLNSEPGEKCNGLNNRTRTRQYQVGGNAQLTLATPVGAGSNRLTAGISYEYSRARFGQTSQYGYLSPDRGVVTVEGPGAFADGTQDSEDAFDARVDLIGRTTGWSAYATDSLDLGSTMVATLSARYDRTHIDNSDRFTPGGGPGSLDGDYVFRRFNPSAGLVWTPSPAISLHASAGQGSRAPSAIELGCADPDNPCRLPNALAGDPPLKQVVARTIDLGANGRIGGHVRWNAGIFRTTNRDDILFVSDDQAGFGYFRNFGKTRRQGIEAGLRGTWPRLRATLDYTYLDATFRSPETVNGEANSSNDGEGPGFEGAIDISPGDRIPLIPRHILKAGMQWDALPSVTLSADVIGLSGVVARGNENGGHEPDGVYYLGEGGTDGYAVVNVGAEYRPVPAVTLYVQIDNALDTDYESAAQLGATGFTGNGAFVARPFATPVIDDERPKRNSTFYAPGAPRSVRVGAKLRF